MGHHDDDDAELAELLEGVMPGLEFATDGLPLPPEPTTGDVQKLMAATDRELSETQRAYYRVQRAKAQASRRWQYHLDRTLVGLANASPERRGAQADREALARRTRVTRDSEEMGDDLYATFLILEAHAEAVREHLYSVRGRLTAMQSLLRSVTERPLI